MNGKILITGGLGYVGGRVAEHLLAVYPGKIRITSRNAESRTPEQLSGAELHTLDLHSSTALSTVLAGVECVIHLAAVNEIESLQDPEMALQVNGLGALRLLNASVIAGVRRFVYFSTAHVYGAPLQGKLDESTLPRPVHPYAITHRTAEDFVLAAGDERRIEAVVLRLSNAVGRPCRPDVNRWSLLANDLCRQAAETGKVVLKTPGLQQRDFISLSDVASATAHFLKLDRSDLGDGLFNLGGGRSLSILEIAQMIAEGAGRRLGARIPLVRPEPKPSDQTPPLRYSIERLLKSGFKPAKPVEDELEEMLEFCATHFTPTAA